MPNFDVYVIVKNDVGIRKNLTKAMLSMKIPYEH